MLPLLLNATPTSFPLVLHNRNILSILPEFPHKLFYMIKEKVSSSQSVKLITWTVIPVIIIFGLLIPIRDFMHTTHTVMQVLYGTVVILVFMMLNAVLFYAPKEVILDDTRLTLIIRCGKTDHTPQRNRRDTDVRPSRHRQHPSVRHRRNLRLHRAVLQP